MMLEINYGIGHFTMDYPRVLSLGFSGLIKEARQKREALLPDNAGGEKALFYEAVIRSLQAGIVFANRYADLAESMAQNERDHRRRAELEEITRVCRRVPEHPPRSFHEAIQSLYFVHLVSQIECGGNSISTGRIDQILYPWFAADIDAGEITADRARELLALFYIKTNEIWNVLEEVFIPGGEGPEGKTTQNVTIGGLGADGEDA